MKQEGNISRRDETVFLKSGHSRFCSILKGGGLQGEMERHHGPAAASFLQDLMDSRVYLCYKI